VLTAAVLFASTNADDILVLTVLNVFYKTGVLT
jgi:cadmium resistance protein CadD (predicted permease)